ncbi:MAG: TVP38/TMEM64 family protein [Cyanobacteria bacterium P01_G01_bin.19]
MRINKYLKIAILIPIGILLVTAPVEAQEAVNNSGLNPKALLCDNALPWIQSLGIAGAIAFMAIYVIATVAFLPGSILTLSGGAIFGLFLGSIYVFVGATVGATLAFLVGRYLARGWISKKIAGNQKFAAIDRAVGEEGLKIVFLTRLSPIFPFNLLNYGLGVTGVSLKDYVLASVGMIPGTIMYVYFGSLGNINTICNGGGAGGNPVAQWAIRIVGLIATVAVTLYVTKIARKALDESIDISEEKQA